MMSGISWKVIGTRESSSKRAQEGAAYSWKLLNILDLNKRNGFHNRAVWEMGYSIHAVPPSAELRRRTLWINDEWYTIVLSGPHNQGIIAILQRGKLFLPLLS